MLRNLLALPEIEGMDLDGGERLGLHADVLARKRMLREVFGEFHRTFMALDLKHFGDTPGLRVELGAGVCPVRDSYPEVLATDVVAGPTVVRTLDAHDMDLEPGSVRALYGQNCFHHFHDPARFFAEMQRVVAPGGGCIFIEPYYGPVASVIYKRLTPEETFDKAMPGWKSAATGPMAGANQALSYIVFRRDAEEFRRSFPDLEIVESRPLSNYARYLLSGGLNFRQLAPNFMIGPIKLAEKALTPALPLLALHQVVVLRRKA